MREQDSAAEQGNGLAGGFAALWGSLWGLLADTLRLAALETRRAGLSLAWMLMLAVMLALLVVTAWLGLMGALAVGLVRLGLVWELALLAVALGNLLLCLPLLRLLVGLSGHLSFPATRRHLLGGLPPDEVSPAAPAEPRNSPPR